MILAQAGRLRYVLRWRTLTSRLHLFNNLFDWLGVNVFNTSHFNTCRPNTLRLSPHHQRSLDGLVDARVENNVIVNTLVVAFAVPVVAIVS